MPFDARAYGRDYYRRNRARLLEQNRAYRQGRPPDAEAASKRLKTYGLTPAAFRSLISEQDGLCAVCRRPPVNDEWHVDHDHDCCPGRVSCGVCVRGLLCQPCNLGLGCLGENWEVVLDAALYLMNSERRRLEESASRPALFDPASDELRKVVESLA